MSDTYSEGTVNITTGSHSVVGNSTYFKSIGLVKAGSMITLDGNKYYLITDVVDDRHLTIEHSVNGSPFEEESIGGASYTIFKNFSRQTNTGLASDFVDFQKKLLDKEFLFYAWVNAVTDRYSLDPENVNDAGILTPFGIEKAVSDNNVKTVEYENLGSASNHVVIASDIETVKDVVLTEPDTRISFNRRNDSKANRITLVIRQGTGNNNVSWEGVSWASSHAPILRKTKNAFDVIDLIVTRSSVIGTQQSLRIGGNSGLWNESGAWNGQNDF